MSDDKSSDDTVPKIQKKEPPAVARCSSVGSLMGMDYDSEAKGGNYSETPRQTQLIPEFSNLSGQADKPTLEAQGPIKSRTRSLKYELEKLIVREKYQLQSTTNEDPLPSSIIKVFKKALGQAFENPLNPLYLPQKKTQEYSPFSMKRTSSITAKSESHEPLKQQHASCQMVYCQLDQCFTNQKLSHLCFGKCFYSKKKNDKQNKKGTAPNPHHRNTIGSHFGKIKF